MISSKRIQSEIDSAEAAFEQCADWLRPLSGGYSSEQVVNWLLQFQPLLAEALSRISRLYRELAQEKKSFVKRKRLLSKGWLSRRLALIASYQEMLTSTLAVGKILGDAFAWIFYSNDRAYLKEHFKRPEIFYHPPGIGGIGEIQFVKNMKMLEGYFILYHGITLSADRRFQSR